MWSPVRTRETASTTGTGAAASDAHGALRTPSPTAQHAAIATWAETFHHRVTTSSTSRPSSTNAVVTGTTGGTPSASSATTTSAVSTPVAA